MFQTQIRTENKNIYFDTLEVENLIKSKLLISGTIDSKSVQIKLLVNLVHTISYPYIP